MNAQFQCNMVFHFWKILNGVQVKQFMFIKEYFLVIRRTFILKIANKFWIMLNLLQIRFLCLSNSEPKTPNYSPLKISTSNQNEKYMKQKVYAHYTPKISFNLWNSDIFPHVTHFRFFLVWRSLNSRNLRRKSKIEDLQSMHIRNSTLNKIMMGS